MMNWLRRAVRLVMPEPPVRHIVMGTRPGYVWEDARGQWVDEEVTWQPGPGTYSLIGPVYVTDGLPV